MNQRLGAVAILVGVGFVVAWLYIRMAQSPPSTSGTPEIGPSGGSMAEATEEDAADSEARAQAQRIYSILYVKCGEDIFFAEKWPVKQLGKAREWRDIVQVKDATFRIAESTVSAADRLNGLEWTGQVVVEGSAHRTFTDGGDRWSQWENGRIGTMGWHQEKSKGKWYFDFRSDAPLRPDAPPAPDAALPRDFLPIACGELPAR
jgi:hypothetical protein